MISHNFGLCIRCGKQVDEYLCICGTWWIVWNIYGGNQETLIFRELFFKALQENT